MTTPMTPEARLHVEIAVLKEKLAGAESRAQVSESLVQRLLQALLDADRSNTPHLISRARHHSAVDAKALHERLHEEHGVASSLHVPVKNLLDEEIIEAQYPQHHNFAACSSGGNEKAQGAKKEPKEEKYGRLIPLNFSPNYSPPQFRGPAMLHYSEDFSHYKGTHEVGSNGFCSRRQDYSNRIRSTTSRRHGLRGRAEMASYVPWDEPSRVQGPELRYEDAIGISSGDDGRILKQEKRKVVKSEPAADQSLTQAVVKKSASTPSLSSPKIPRATDPYGRRLLRYGDIDDEETRTGPLSLAQVNIPARRHSTPGEDRDQPHARAHSISDAQSMGLGVVIEKGLNVFEPATEGNEKKEKASSPAMLDY